MGKWIGIAFAFLLILVMILMFPNMQGAIHTAGTSSITDTFAPVNTGAGVYTTTLNLTVPLYNSDILEVLEVTSDNTQDHPSVLSYTSDTQDLIVKSLYAGASRNITVIYNTGAAGGFLGTGSVFKIAPLLIFLMILGIGGLAIWAGFARNRG